MYVLIFVPMMEVEEYLQVDFEHLMPRVVEPRMNDDDDDEHLLMYVHPESSRMDYHEHSIINERNKHFKSIGAIHHTND